MPVKYSPNTVVVNNVPSEGHITITLELNINLNANGVDASIRATGVREPEPDVEDEFEFAIPEFGSKTIEFGKPVNV